MYGMLGALMYASKVAMEVLPNVHLLGPKAPVDLPDYLCRFDVCL